MRQQHGASVHATTSLSLSLSPTWRWACLRLDAQAVKEKGLSLYSMDEFKKLGAAKPAEAVPPSPEELCTIMYTSGTTGVRVCVRVCVCARVCVQVCTIMYTSGTRGVCGSGCRGVGLRTGIRS